MGRVLGGKESGIVGREIQGRGSWREKDAHVGDSLDRV